MIKNTYRQRTMYNAVLSLLKVKGPCSVSSLLSSIDQNNELNDNGLIFLSKYILAANASDEILTDFHSLITKWDHDKSIVQLNKFPLASYNRRKEIYKLLCIPSQLSDFWDKQLPFKIQTPVVIADEHINWYDTRINTSDYFWKSYERYLLSNGWNPASTIDLGNGAQSILERLSAPYREEAYSARGLVVGYVQSGKTANFSALLAKAADAGYKMFIILAGPWNILRKQTQRRIDKGLIGCPSLKYDDDYKTLEDSEWADFVNHNKKPHNLFGWNRITTLEEDYKRLLSDTLNILVPEKEDKDLPLHCATNLFSPRAKINVLVIKKNAQIISKLIADLTKLNLKYKGLLNEIPTLLIDDESDQASIDTRRPNKKELEERRKVNGNIIDVLKIMPRCQYVGYTATPYANVFINPDDVDDLFPKDFIITLPEPPSDYMGARDFFNIDNDPNSNEKYFIKKVKSSHNEQDDLSIALTAFVLSGAIKLFRKDKHSSLAPFKHHTMLVHISRTKLKHNEIEALVKKTWEDCNFQGTDGLFKIQQLWNEDYRPTSEHINADLPLPDSFQDLIPYIQNCIGKITECSGNLRTIIVNGDNKNNPDFELEPIWSVIIGGDKLSRGYTIEDLTISYYRRITSQGDTLMQMGRWFGFRKGYCDLVRLFIGIDEGKKNIDLLESFRATSRMEAHLRQELKRYVSSDKKLTPLQVPPLVQAFSEIKPTAKNKMYNAKITSWNYGKTYNEPTTIPDAKTDKFNIALFEEIFTTTNVHRDILGGIFKDKGKKEFSSYYWTTSIINGLQFLKNYKWNKVIPESVNYQLDFISNENHGMQRMLFLAPLLTNEKNGTQELLKHKISIRHRRTRSNGGPFGVYSDPIDSATAKYVAGWELPESGHYKLLTPNESTKNLRNTSTAVVLIYFVKKDNKTPTLGWSITYPKNNLGFIHKWSVRNIENINSPVVHI